MVAGNPCGANGVVETLEDFIYSSSHGRCKLTGHLVYLLKSEPT